MTLDTTKELTLRELWRLLSAEEDTQAKAIRELSKQIRETRSMSLDLPAVKENSIASFRETTGGMMTGPLDINQQVPNKGYELSERRSRIIQLNNTLAEQAR